MIHLQEYLWIQMVNGGIMILKMNVCMFENDGCVPIMVHNRYFFVTVEKIKVFVLR